jgi:hypothetical protein
LAKQAGSANGSPGLLRKAPINFVECSPASVGVSTLSFEAQLIASYTQLPPFVEVY